MGLCAPLVQPEPPALDAALWGSVGLGDEADTAHMARPEPAPVRINFAERYHVGFGVQLRPAILRVELIAGFEPTPGQTASGEQR